MKTDDTEHPRPLRVAVVGMGNVGSTFAYALLLSGLASEIVVMDANRAKAKGEAMDLEHTVPFANPTRIWAGDYPDFAGTSVTVLAAGAAQKPGETRLDLIKKNAAIWCEIVPEVVKHNPAGILLIATFPWIARLCSLETFGFAGPARARLRHDPRYFPLPLPAQPALRSRCPQCPRPHHR